MKKLFHMTILAMAVLMGTGVAMAGSVDIGVGEMDQAEFESMRQMIGGEPAQSQVITNEKPEAVYVGELKWSDVEDIRQAMAFGDNSRNEAAAASSGPVDIGLGAMSNNEFCDLNKLVASNNNSRQGFDFICP